MPTFSRERKPPDGKRHTWYKPCLRLDFQFRCAYCLIHEVDYQGHESFQVDHFRPKSKFPEVERQYANLYLACILCNKQGRKGGQWPSDEELRAGHRFVDPCSEEWEDHVEFLDDGAIRALSPAGEYAVRIIKLDRPQLRRHRVKFPGEYANRSKLRRVAHQLETIAALVRDRDGAPRELTQEIRQLQKVLPLLQHSVAQAWSSKEPFPPLPKCPY